MKTKRTLLITGGSIILLLALILSPIKVPMSLDIPCKIRPAYSWIVKLGADANVATTLFNSSSGIIEDYFSAVPSRGDIYAFQLKNGISQNWIGKGDTIGYINSNLTSQQLASLEGRLSTAKGTLNLLLTGEKESLVKYAREQVNAAREKASYLKKLYDRKKALFDDGLLSSEEIELHKSDARQAEIEVSVFQANLESVESGSKTEQINLVKNEIRAVESEIEIIKEKLASFIITSPIAGNLISYNSSDTILTVNSPDFVLIIPVNWKYNILLNVGQAVEIADISAGDSSFRIKNIRSGVEVFNGQQVVVVIAESEKNDLVLPENLWLKCNLNLGEFTLLEFLKWKLLQTYEV